MALRSGPTWLFDTKQLEIKVTKVTKSDKRFAHGLFGGVTNKKRLFANFCVRTYKTSLQYVKDSLSKFFADQAAVCTTNDFEIIGSNVNRDLRDLLCNYGVQVPKSRKVLIFGELQAVMMDNIPQLKEIDEEDGKIYDATNKKANEQVHHMKTSSMPVCVEHRGFMVHAFENDTIDEDCYS